MRASTSRAKTWGCPVYALYGGPVRERIPVYWSHMGTYRVRNAAHMGTPPLLTHEELAAHAAEIKALGFRALKTNIMPVEGGRLTAVFARFRPLAPAGRS